MPENQPDLRTTIGNITLKNPVMTASGTFGYGIEFQNIIDLNQLGAIIVKGLSLKPSIGNPPQRIAETACGMLNAIGLENIGIEKFISEKLPILKQYSTHTIVNIYGTTISEYAQLAERIDGVDGISGVEVNISCPNIKAGGLVFGVDPAMVSQVVREVRNHTRLAVIVKLTPNVTDITSIALSAESAGADAVSLINTITGMAIDIHRRRPKLANIVGGLSGPAIKPIALRMVWQVAQKVRIPVIGIGGITTAEDALEFFIAGASAVQVGTANFINPRSTINIIQGIESYFIKKGIGKLSDLIGSLQI